MTYGPIDFLALEFEGNQFKGEILPSLLELVDQKIIRVIDLVIVRKETDGEVAALELQQLDSNTMADLDPLGIEVPRMNASNDIDMIGAQLADNSTAAIMLFENLWAVKFKEAVLEANGRVIMQERIPHEVVLDALEEMATLA